jgi:hypothetical protein
VIFVKLLFTEQEAVAPPLLQLESHCSAPCVGGGLVVAPLFAATSESICIKWMGQLIIMHNQLA